MPFRNVSFTGESSWTIRTERIKGRRNRRQSSSKRRDRRMHSGPLATSHGERTSHPTETTLAISRTKGLSAQLRLSEIEATPFCRLNELFASAFQPSVTSGRDIFQRRDAVGFSCVGRRPGSRPRFQCRTLAHRGVGRTLASG